MSTFDAVIEPGRGERNSYRDSTLRIRGYPEMMRTRTNPQIRLLPSVLLAVAVAVAGCVSTSNRDIGTGLGALFGGFLGHQIDDGGAAGTAIGVIVGGFIGRQFGQYMDKNDQREMALPPLRYPPG